MRQHFVRMGKKVVQQIKLRRRKARNTPIRSHLAIAKADFPVRQAKYSCFAEGRDRSSGERCPNASRQVIDVERCGNIAVRARI